MYTIPLIREQHESYLYNIDTHSLVETPDEPSFSIPFTSPLNNILNHPPINKITKFLAIVEVVIEPIIENSLENLDINLVLTPAQTLAQKVIMITPLTTIIQIMIVTNLAMINIIETLLQEPITLLAQVIIQYPLVVHIILTLVLANAPLVGTTPHLDAINNHIVLLLSHVLIATKVDLTLIQTLLKLSKQTHC